jgi:two-component system phosphate regulon sensor histidine kinase PhoR
MKKIGLFWKHFLRYFFIIIITVLLVVVFASREIRRHFFENLSSSLFQQAYILKRQLVPLLQEGDMNEIDRFVDALGEYIEARVTVIDSAGSVLGDTDGDPAEMENHSNRPEVIQAMRSQQGQSTRYSTTLDQDFLYVALPVSEGDTIIGVVRVSSSLDEINEGLWAINRSIIIIAGILTILALFFAMLTSRSFTRPISEINQAAKRIQNGDFGTRLFIRRHDELQGLASAINEMARELERLFDRLTGERRELQTIISSMTEGLLVIEKNGNIVITNKSFADMLGANDVKELSGKRYWEVLPNQKLDELIKLVFENKKPSTQEIEINGNTLLASGAIVPEPSGEQRMILVFHNITESKRLEKIKSDFVANVAHELKTPLTAIKGFAETLEDEAGLEHKRFLQIIRSNTDRLINIVSDLLLLSNLESPTQKLLIEKVDLRRLLDDISPLFTKKIAENNIIFTYNIPSNLPPLLATPFYLNSYL